MDSEKQALINSSEPRTNSQGLFAGYIQPCLAEFVAMIFFVFIGTMSVHRVENYSIGIALAHGLTITIFVAVMGPISGAHINPAVTLAMVLIREMPIVLGLLYFISQIIGSLIGAAFTRVVLTDAVYNNISGGAHTLGPFVEPGPGILCEVLLTAVLVLTILHVAVDPKTQSNLAPLAIGFAVVVDILAGISITGASMNPARSFGPAVVLSVLDSSIWDYHYIYWVGPVLGSILACLIYKFVLADENKRLIMKEH